MNEQSRNQITNNMPEIIDGLVDNSERTLIVLKSLHDAVGFLLEANKLMAKQIFELKKAQNDLFTPIAN